MQLKMYYKKRENILFICVRKNVNKLTMVLQQKYGRHK